MPPNFRGEDFLNFSQSETRITHGDHGFCSMMKSYIGPFIDASCKIFPYLGKWSQMKRFFGNQPTRNNNCLWQSCLFTDRNEMSSLYRGPSIDASIPSFITFGQAVSEEKIFRNRPIRNKNCLWRTYFLMDWEKYAIFIKDFP